MGIGDIIGVIAFIVGVVIAYPALLVMLSIVLPRMTAKARQRLDRGLRLPLVVGIVVWVVWGGAGFTLLQVGGPPQLIGAILMLALSLWGTIGLAGLAQVFGARLTAVSERQPSALREWMSGAGVLTLSFAFPVLGWLILIPLATLIGAGAATLSLVTRLQTAAPLTVTGDAAWQG